MKGEQQKILHKGTNDKVNAFITLLYPYNGIKFNMGKTRNSTDFINHLKNIKRYVLKRNIKRFILVTGQRIVSCQQKDQTVCGKTIWMAYSRVSTKKSTISKPCGNQGKQKSEERHLCKLLL